MPANLTPQYMDAEQRFKRASTTPEKIAALEEMMAVIPRHKGTEKLQAEWFEVPANKHLQRREINVEIASGGWRPLDLQLQPFNFPAPLQVLN